MHVLHGLWGAQIPYETGHGKAEKQRCLSLLFKNAIPEAAHMLMWNTAAHVQYLAPRLPGGLCTFEKHVVLALLAIDPPQEDMLVVGTRGN